MTRCVGSAKIEVAPGRLVTTACDGSTIEATDVRGSSGWCMLLRLVDGETVWGEIHRWEPARFEGERARALLDMITEPWRFHAWQLISDSDPEDPALMRWWRARVIEPGPPVGQGWWLTDGDPAEPGWKPTPMVCSAYTWADHEHPTANMVASSQGATIEPLWCRLPQGEKLPALGGRWRPHMLHRA